MKGSLIRAASSLCFLLVAGCARPVPAVPLPEPPEPAYSDFPHSAVWTAGPGLALRSVDGGPRTPLPYAFTPLVALGRDSLGLRVFCPGCIGHPEGYVDLVDVVHTPSTPGGAAAGRIGEFALAVRQAALERDLAALRPAMTHDFSFSFVGPQTAEMALAVWSSEDFRMLDRVPALLDRGLASRDGRIWTAPPDFVERLDYRGPRLGFRLSEQGMWEWIYLIEPVTP